MWEPKHGKRNCRRGKPFTIYVDQLRSDTGLKSEDLMSIAENRELSEVTSKWKVTN